MYYPGLFESATNPYSAFTTRPFIKNGDPTTTVPSYNNNAELCLSLVNKKIIPSSSSTNNNSTTSMPNSAGAGSGGGAISPLVGSFGLTNFCPPVHPYNGQPHGSTDPAGSLMASFGPPTAASNHHHLSAENYNSNILREQHSSLMEVPPGSYGIGSIQTAPSYAPHYYMNPSPVLNAGYKISNGSTYPSAVNNFYRSSNGPYHQGPAIYNESFIPDYMNRTIDTSKSFYGFNPEHNSFSDHLKRLQESFQSKSKCTDCSSSSNGQNAIPENVAYYSPHLCQNHSEQSVNNNHSHNHRLSDAGKSEDPQSTIKRDPKRPLNGQSKSCQQHVWNPCLIGSHNNNNKKSPEICTNDNNNNNHHHNNSSSNHDNTNNTNNNNNNNNNAKNSQKQGDHQHELSSAKRQHEHHNHHSPNTETNQNLSNDLQHHNEIIMKTNKAKEGDKQLHAKSGKSQNNNPMIIKPKHSVNRPKSQYEINKKSFNISESIEQIKNNEGQNWNIDDQSSCEYDEEKKIPRYILNEPNKTKDVKVSKKSAYYGRRRRFRSGLDMIRNSRKKPKTKLIRREHHKKETMDNRPESRRLMVNKSLGETLLHRSARNNRLDVVRQCLESESCDVNARDNAGYTPLHECSSRGNLEVARLLLQHSADVNASATGGIRPLHDAIENNHIEVVRLLISYGADPHISTYSGTTPLQLCRSKLMCKFLEGFYQDINTERMVEDDSNVWKFKYGSLDKSGFDIFDDIQENEMNDNVNDNNMELIFELSCKPFLNLYTFLHKPNQCLPFYLLSDVIKTLKITRENFINKYPNVRIARISQSDFMNSALVIQLEARINKNNNHIINKNKRDCYERGGEIEIIFQDEQINNIIDVETAVISL